MAIKITILDENKDTHTQCSVCYARYVNKAGSTSCCGGINEILYKEEVEELGIDSTTTNNDEMRPRQD